MRKQFVRTQSQPLSALRRRDEQSSSVRKHLIRLLYCCGVLVAASANAQTPEASQPQAQTSAGKEVDDRHDDGDLGRQSLLRRRERPRWFRISSDTQYLYDSNVLLADGEFIQKGDDAVFIQSFGASFTPPLLERLTSGIYYHHEIVRYDEFNKFDFDADTAGLRLGYPVKDWFNVYGGWSASRYSFQGHGGEFYRFYDTRIGLEREQPITRRLLLTYGYQFDWKPSSPARLTRADNAAYLGLGIALADKLTAQVFYRLRAREYLRTDRTDVDHLVSLSLGYAFNDYVSLRVSGSYGENSSTLKAHDYEVFTAGGGLNLSFKF